MNDNNEYQLLLNTVKQTYASVVWTHKIQEKQADIIATRYKVFETIASIAEALTTAGIMATIFEDALWVKVCSAVLSFVSLAISAYFKSFDLQTIAKSHKEAANGFLLVRDDLLVIISDIFRKKDLSAIDENYAKVRKTLNKLYTTAPQTTNKAVEIATKALGADKEYTFSAKEINRFLPDALRGDL